jgi:CRP-like cAMP-binding protein
MATTFTPRPQLTAALLDVVTAAPMLEGVDTAHRIAFANAGFPHRYRAGTVLFVAGDEADAVCCVVEGRVQIEVQREDGRSMLRSVLGVGQMFGELGVLAHLPRTATAVALDDCCVWKIAASAFHDFLTRVPAATHALLRVLALQVIEHEAFVEDLLFLDLKARVAKRLLALVSTSWDELPDDGAAVPLNITQNDLANLCGGSRENVNRVLSELTRRGLVGREGQSYVLHDIGGLRRLARI